MNDYYDKHARESAKCMRDALIVVAIGIVLIVAFGFMLGTLAGCETTQHARQEREIAAKAAHKRAYQKPPLPESAAMMWWDGHWQEVLSTVAGVLATTLAVIRKGRKG